MSRSTHWSKTALFLSVAVAVAGVPAAAMGPATPEQSATVNVFPTGVQFQPNTSFKQAVVTVSGAGKAYRYVFSAGSTPEIGSFDPQGQPLPDGSYAWQLELLPTREAARQLAIAARDNGGIAPNAPAPLSGTFTIAGGYLASPELQEVEPVREVSALSAAEHPTHLAGEMARSERPAAIDSDEMAGFGLAAVSEEQAAPAALAVVAASGTPAMDSDLMAPPAPAQGVQELSAAGFETLEQKPGKSLAEGDAGRPEGAGK